MRTLAHVSFAVALSLFAFPRPAAAQVVPLVLYTDLLSGPNSGGEKNLGTYLSIFGKNFGEASDLGSVTKVFIGGAEVATYRYLGPSQGRLDIQQITVQIGPLNNPKPGVALPIEVRIGTQKSKSFSPQTFTVNPGRILFVSPQGDDATAIPGDISYPWRHLQTPAAALSGVWGAAKPGDVIVLRGGLWTDLGFSYSGRTFFVKFFGNSGTAPTGTPGSGPISFTSYPNEKVEIHPDVKLAFGVFDGLSTGNFPDADGKPKYSQWLTFSNLVISTGGINDGPINLENYSDHWRVVNNDLSSPDAVTNRAGGVTGNGRFEAVLGNHIHDIAGVGSRGETLLDHGIYIDSGSDWEIAFNRIENITGGNGIQLYNSGHATPTIDNIKIHHNWISGVSKHGLNIADTSGVGIDIWSNIVYNTAGGCWRNNSTNIHASHVWNNTFFNCNLEGNSGALWNDVRNLNAPITIDFHNNIVWPSPKSSHYFGGETGLDAPGVKITGSHNLFFGGKETSLSPLETQALLADPGFLNPSLSAPDFHLKPGSSAFATGTTDVLSLVNSNYDLEPPPPPSKKVNRGAI